MKIVHLLLSTALLLPVSMTAQAQMNHEGSEMHEKKGKRGGKHGGKKGFMKKLKALNLSAEQLEQLKAIKKEKKSSKEAHKASRQEMKNLKEKLRLALKGSQSQSEVKAINDEIKKLHSKRQDERFNMMLKIREILTPEQRAKFDFSPGKGKKDRK
ncbi:Spy/CpxP family protein refolding chaperone [bacterium]|nr:Spy/CpxP family protein refolding chaperone [bacterium]